MQYLLTIYIDESAAEGMTPEQALRTVEGYESLTAELKQAGIFLGGEGLQATSTATTVRVRDGEPLLTDGPFAETREQLAGFYLLECADLDEAVRWAAKVPSAVVRLDRGPPRHRLRQPGRAGREPRRGGAGLSAAADLDRLFRRESAQAVAALARALGDLDRAEEAVQDAYATALERWPRDGAPANPAAWIMAVARNRALDRIRAERRSAARAEELARLEALTGDDDGPAEDDVSSIADERLRLIFTCCHPALAPEARVALTLRLLGGLTTAEVARAFLVSEPAMAQRVVRAKAKIRGGRDRVRAAARQRPPGAARLRARDALPRLQRGLRRDRRRRADPARAVRRGDPARARAVRADARRGRGARPARADAPARLPPRDPRRGRRHARAARRPGPRRAGTARRSPRAWS